MMRRRLWLLRIRQRLWSSLLVLPLLPHLPTPTILVLLLLRGGAVGVVPPTTRSLVDNRMHVYAEHRLRLLVGTVAMAVAVTVTVALVDEAGIWKLPAPEFLDALAQEV